MSSGDPARSAEILPYLFDLLDAGFNLAPLVRRTVCVLDRQKMVALSKP
jgi:hypothetical protein